MDFVKNIFELPASTKIFVGISIFLLAISNAVFFRRFDLIGGGIMVLAHVGLTVLLVRMSNYTVLHHLLIFIIPSLLLGFVFFAFSTGSSAKEVMSGSGFVIDFPGSQKTKLDILRGLAIFGAAGSGKTKSGFIPIIKHASEHNMSGIFYDYKDFELTEYVNFFYTKSDIPIYTISPARPEYSHRVNPIDPKYIETFADVNTITSTFIQNLAAATKEKFFTEAAESALSAVIWKTKEQYPELCSFPIVTSIILTKDAEELGKYIESSQYASILGKTFLDGLSSDRQTASVMSTLSSAMRKIISPEIFTIFSGNDFDLKLNDPEKPAILNVINHPKYKSTITPFLATLVQTAMLQMSERNRNPSILLLDEAPTLKLADMSGIPATMRSYNIATVYGIQDKVQGEEVYNETTLRAIMANLSSRLMGKVNDPDTGKYYERFFELVKEESKSINRSTSIFNAGDTRVSVGERDRVKHRAYEFFKLRPGEFFIFDEKGNDSKVKFKEIECNPVPSTKTVNYSKKELLDKFDDTINIARQLC
jgi:type IV secretory pathway TraG/TraD family ATPase VirD4